MSPGSTEEKLREMYDEVSAAVEDGLVNDTTSKNSLYKIHVSLGKIVNALDESANRGHGRSSRAGSVLTDRQTTEERSVAEEHPTITEGGSDDGDTVTVMPRVEEQDETGDDVSEANDTSMKEA